MSKQQRYARPRAALAELQGWRCYLCGAVMTDPRAVRPSGLPREIWRARLATFDHLWPISMTRANRVSAAAMTGAVACAACNKTRGARPPRPCEALFVDALLLAARKAGAMDLTDMRTRRVAQRKEHPASNRKAAGSSPAAPAACGDSR
jgi:hypothetical protein